VPRGHRRSSHDGPAPSDSPAITIEEAQRRGLWPIYRLRKGAYTFVRPGQALKRLKLVTWAVDKEAAKRTCVQLGRDDRSPGFISRNEIPGFARRRRPRPPLPDKPVDRSVFPCGCERTPENTYVYRGRGPGCLRCRRARSLAAYEARKEAQP